MRPSLLAGLVLALLFCCAGSLSLSAQEVCPPTPLYAICDVVFDAAPGELTQLFAEIKSPKFRTSLVPAFYDGGRRWIIRFAPIDAGRYELRLTSNLPRYSGKVLSAEALPSDHPGFIRRANVQHWIYPETIQPHLWAGAINHTRLNLGSDLKAAEERIRAENAKGVIVDLVLAASPAEIESRFPAWRDREQWVTQVTSRLAAFDITWVLATQWEGHVNGRALLKEVGQLIQKHDPYGHPRSAGSRWTSSALAADGWMDYITIGADSVALPAVERVFEPLPLVTTAKAQSGEAYRKQLWNATISGQYPSLEGGDPAVLKIWKEFFERTRYWELQPYFDVDGGRALALDEVEYIVYVEKPAGPVEVFTARHGYDVYWMNPATGEIIKGKDYRGERFVSEPPTSTHDWVLHLSRDGRKEGMRKSYKFESRANLTQEIEQTEAKVPFEIAEPASGQVSLSRPVPFKLTVKRETRATRFLQVVWTAEVVPDGQGAHVIGTGVSGTADFGANIAVKFPAVLNVHVRILNANGKAYALDRVYELVR